MTKREKEVLQASLDNEKLMLEQIEQNYINALADIKKKIKKLQEMPDTQSRAYQIDFQKQLENQVNTYIDILQSGNVETIEDYLNLCYETGFVGNVYQLQGCDISLVAPINQNAVVNATKMTADGVKLSAKLAGDTELLKKQVVQEIQRGFSVAMPYADIARNISARGQASMNRSLRIARTEGNRVYNEAAYDSAQAAIDAGVDTVKQWVSVLDAKTRESHQNVDSEWVEVDEKFSNGLFLPCDRNGPAAEIVNCRCKAAFVPRWTVEKNYPRLRRDNDTGEIIECQNYAEFKEKYLNDAARLDKINWNKAATSSDRTQFKNYKNVLGSNAPKTLDEFCKIKYNGGDEWEKIKYYYRTVNRYEVDGHVSAEKIVKLDNAAFYTKKTGFDYSNLTGKDREHVKKLSNSGNAASMEFDGNIYFSHSAVKKSGTLKYDSYNGKYPLVGLTDNRKLKVKDLGDRVPREYDTEAKFLEFVASQKNVDETFSVTILSEKHICESCQGVVEQFKNMYPNATVNIISGKRGYNGSKDGLKTWQHRKKVK